MSNNYKSYNAILFSGFQSKRRAIGCGNIINSCEFINFYKCFSGETEKYKLILNGLSKPISIIYDNQNNLYITIDSSNEILKLDPYGNLTKFITSGLSLPVAMAFDKFYENMYVTNFFNNTISKINMETKEITNLVLNYNPNDFRSGYPLNMPNGLCFDSTFENLYATNVSPSANNIVKINIATLNTAIFTDNILSPILIVSDNKKNSTFYVTCLVTSEIYKIDSEGNKSLFIKSPFLYGPRAICFNPNYSSLFVTNSKPSNNCIISMVEIDLNGNIINLFKNNILDNPRGLCFNSNGYLFISNFGNGTIYEMI